MALLLLLLLPVLGTREALLIEDGAGRAVATLLPSLALVQLAPWPSALHLSPGRVVCAVASGEGPLLLRLLGSWDAVVACDTRRLQGDRNEATRAVWMETNESVASV